MAAESAPPRQSLGEEIANSVTHGVGAALGLVALVTLVVLAALRGDAWRIVSCSIYGATLVLLYVISTLYHSLRGPRVKRVFRILDHSSIYLLIAGTYTPFGLVTLRGPWGFSLLGVVWGLAAFGIVFKAIWVERLPALSTAVYVLMGWAVVVAIKPLLAALPIGGIAWLVAGGLAYTGGVAFFALDHRIRYGHMVWHLFVLAGSVCHFLAILLYVVPRPS